MKLTTNYGGRDTSGESQFPRRQDLELLLPQSALETIAEEVVANRNQRRETGGVLLGGRANVNRFFAVDATGPGPDARHYEAEFSPDVAYAQRRLDELREDWDVFWIGVWHKHPGNMRSLSEGDVEQMRGLVRDPDTLDEIISVIATRDDRTVRLTAYHMDESLEPYRLGMTTVQDDAPIHRQFSRDTDPVPVADDEEGARRRRWVSGCRPDRSDDDVEQDGGSRVIPCHGKPDDGPRGDFVRTSQSNEDGVDDDSGGSGANIGKTGSRSVPDGVGGVTSGDAADGEEGQSHEGLTAQIIPLDSDGGLGTYSVPPSGSSVPRTATVQGLFDAGIREIGELQCPGYEPLEYDADRDDIALTVDDTNGPNDGHSSDGTSETSAEGGFTGHRTDGDVQRSTDGQNSSSQAWTSRLRVFFRRTRRTLRR